MTTSTKRKCIQYLPKLGRTCLHTVEQGYWKCYQHRMRKFPRPKDCPICASELPKYTLPLNPCGHYVCWDCIVHSGKDLCPMCRHKVKIPYKHLMMLKFYAKGLETHLNNANLELALGEEYHQLRDLIQNVMGIVDDRLSEVTSSEIYDS